MAAAQQAAQVKKVVVAHEVSPGRAVSAIMRALCL
jgi:hypothetical protein